MFKGPFDDGAHAFGYGLVLEVDAGDACVAQCVTVMPAVGVKNSKISTMVEGTAARHLSQRPGRVIGPIERRHVVRKLVVDLKNTFDRNHYLAATGCKHFAVPSVKSIENTFLVFWSQMDVELQLSIESPGKGEYLWYARHKARRGNGGLPLSPPGLGAAVISAGWVQGDGDRLPSIIDDAMRRMALTIPDTRQFSVRPRQRLGAERALKGNPTNRLR
ncbi:MAG: hypothetical protein VYE18_05740 [Pseudomonadota bacterium]|nr:hypothetical protein [Pseudomonadota bacterium]